MKSLVAAVLLLAGCSNVQTVRTFEYIENNRHECADFAAANPGMFRKNLVVDYNGPWPSNDYWQKSFSKSLDERVPYKTNTDWDSHVSLAWWQMDNNRLFITFFGKNDSAVVDTTSCPKTWPEGVRFYLIKEKERYLINKILIDMLPEEVRNRQPYMNIYQ